jgi:WhiB family redox-sensing transcriptional regulator
LWFARARCRGEDPNTFMPAFTATGAKAKAMCADCVVREPCLDYALRRPGLVGVWGGRTERERARMRPSAR